MDPSSILPTRPEFVPETVIDLAPPASALDVDAPEPDQTDDTQAEADRKQRVDEFISRAIRQWQLVEDTERDLRERMLADLEFVQPGGQWERTLAAARKVAGDPCLEIDGLSQSVKQVCNQQRQLRPAIQVSPVDSGSDPDTAEVLQGLVRHIETQSDADVAYDTAGEQQVIMGRGYARVITEYADELGFEQQIRIKRVRNPFSVYLDPTHQSPDASDARFGFIVQDVPNDEYDARFGTTEDRKPSERIRASLEQFSGPGNSGRQDWAPEGCTRIAEYFYRDDIDMAVVETPKGGTVRVAPEQVQKGQRSRRVLVRKVYWALINAVDILEGNDDRTEGREWPGQFIPIVPCIGDEADLDGKVDLRGIVRKAKDPQRMSNYWYSFVTGRIALASRAPVVGAEGQFEGHEAKWKSANRIPYPYLEYKPVTIGDKLAPPPQRDNSEPPIQAATVALEQAQQALRVVTGYVDVQANETKSETSGRAILARQKQSELGNSNYIDNLGRFIRQLGRIVVDLIPKIYDVPRIVRIIGLDQQPKTVMVGPGAQLPTEKPKGIDGIYDIGVGRYDVMVSVGPSQLSQRTEFVDAALQMAQAMPNQAPFFMDLVVEHMDWPGAKGIAERLKKMLPPPLQEQKPGEEQIPPQIAQKIAQYEQMLDAQTQQLNALADERDNKAAELASKERIAAMQVQADLTKTEATLNAQAAQTLLLQQVAAIRQQLDHLQSNYQSEQQMALKLATAAPPAEPGGAPPSNLASQAPVQPDAPIFAGGEPAPEPM